TEGRVSYTPPRGEGRRGQIPYWPWRVGFDPRPPEESDQLIPFQIIPVFEFRSTPPRGERPLALIWPVSISLSFGPTPPRGERPGRSPRNTSSQSSAVRRGRLPAWRPHARPAVASWSRDNS